MSSPTVGATEAPDRSLAHKAYGLSLLTKALIGGLQLSAGLALALVPSGRAIGFVEALARYELVEDPADPAALWVLHALTNLPVGSEGFYIVYLLLHGALNLGLCAALVARLGWSFPVAIVVLFGFIGYQVAEYFGGRGAMMLVLSLIDIVVIALVLREWRHFRWHNPLPARRGGTSA